LKNYFESIYGNADSIRYFTDAIESGRLAHAYILEGPAGCGKRTFAKAIAAQRVRHSPFAERIPRDASPDLAYFGLIEKKKTVGVDTVRALKSAVYIKPSELDAKFFILTDCHLMTEQAQNAALKILEEPPQGVYFFLCTENASALLPTVRSRAQTVRMQIFSDEELACYAVEDPSLKQLSTHDPQAFAQIIRNAGGCLGGLKHTAQGKDSSLFESRAKELISLLDVGQYLPLFLFCSKVADSRSQLEALLEQASLGLRDVLAIRINPHAALMFYTDAAVAEQAASHLSDRSILAVITEMERTRGELAGNPNLKGMLALLADALFRATQN